MHLKIMLLLGVALVLVVPVTESNEILKLPFMLIQNGLNDEFIQGKIFPFLVDVKDSIEQLRDNNAVSKLVNRVLQEGKEDLKSRLKRDVSNILTKNCSKNHTSIFRNGEIPSFKSDSSNVSENSRKAIIRRFKRNIEFTSSDVLLSDTFENQEENNESMGQDLESINEKGGNMRGFGSHFESFLENKAVEQQIFEPGDGRMFPPVNRRFLEAGARRIFEPENRRIFESENRRFFEAGDRPIFEPENAEFFEPGNRRFLAADARRNFAPDDRRIFEPEDTRIFEPKDARFFVPENRHNTKLRHTFEYPGGNADRNFESVFGHQMEPFDSEFKKDTENEFLYGKRKHTLLNNNVENPEKSTHFVDRNLKSIIQRGANIKGFDSQFQRGSENYSKDGRSTLSRNTYNNLDTDAEYVDRNLETIFEEKENMKRSESQLQDNLENQAADRNVFTQHFRQTHPFNLQNLPFFYYKTQNSTSENATSSPDIPKQRNILTRKKRNVLTYSNPSDIINQKEHGQNTLLDAKNYLDIKQVNNSLINNLPNYENNPSVDSEKIFNFIQNLNSSDKKLLEVNRSLDKNIFPSHWIHKDNVPTNYMFQKNGIKEFSVHSIATESIQTPEEESLKRNLSSASDNIKNKSLQQLLPGNRKEFSISGKSDTFPNSFEVQENNLLKGKNHSRNKWHNGNAFAVGDVSANQKKDNITRTDQINSDENADKQISNAARKLLISKKNGEKGTMESIIRNQKGYALEDVGGDYSKQNKGILNAEAIKENSMRNDRKNEKEEADKSPIDAGKAGFIFRSFDRRDDIRPKFANKRNKFHDPRLGVGKNMKLKSKPKKNNEKNSRRSKMKHAGRNAKKYDSRQDERNKKNKPRQSGKVSKISNKRNNLDKKFIKHSPAVRQSPLKTLFRTSFTETKNAIDPKLKHKKQLNLKEREIKKKLKTPNSPVSREKQVRGLKGSKKLQKVGNKIRKKFQKIERNVNLDKTRNNPNRFKSPLKQNSFDKKDTDLTSNLLVDKKKSVENRKHENTKEKTVRNIHNFKNTAFPFNKSKLSMNISQNIEDKKSGDKNSEINGFRAFHFNEPNSLNSFRRISEDATPPDGKMSDRNPFLSGIGNLFNNIHTNTRSIISGIVDGIKSGIKGAAQDFIHRVPKSNLIQTVIDNPYVKEIPIKLKVKIISEKEENVQEEASDEGNKKKIFRSENIPEIRVQPLRNSEDDSQGKFRIGIKIKDSVLSEDGNKIDAVFSHKRDSPEQTNKILSWKTLNEDSEGDESRLTDKIILNNGVAPQFRGNVQLDNSQFENKKDPKCHSKGVNYYIILQEKDSDTRLNGKNVFDNNELSLMFKNKPAGSIRSNMYVQSYGPKDKFHFEKKGRNPQTSAFPQHKNEINEPRINIVIGDNINSNRIKYENGIEGNLGENEMKNGEHFEPIFLEAKRFEIKESKGNINNIGLLKDQIPMNKLNSISNLTSLDKQNGDGFRQRNPLISEENNDTIFKHSLFQQVSTTEATGVNSDVSTWSIYKFAVGLQNTKNPNEVLRNNANDMNFGKSRENTMDMEAKEADAMEAQNPKMPHSEINFALESASTNLKEIMHPKQRASYIIHPTNEAKNTINQKILFQDSSKMPADINRPNMSKKIQEAKNVNLGGRDVIGDINPEKLSYHADSNRNIKPNPSSQHGTSTVEASLKPNQNFSSSDHGISRTDISVKPNRLFFNKLKSACGKSRKLSREDKNDKTDFENQSHVIQRNGASRRYEGIQDETGTDISLIQFNDLKAEDGLGVEMKTADERNLNSNKNALDWNEISKVAPRFDSFLRNIIMDDGKKTTILPSKKNPEMNFVSSSDEIEKKNIHDQRKNYELNDVRKRKHSLGVNDLSQLFLDTHYNEVADKNSGSEMNVDPIENKFLDNLVYEKPAEVFISGSLRKVEDAEKVPERNNKNNLSKNFLMNDALPNNDILMNLIQLSLKNSDENHNVAKENSSLNTAGTFMNKIGEGFGENSNKNSAMKNINIMLSENPVRGHLNPSDLKMFTNSMISTNNHEAAIPFNSGLEVKFKNLVQPNDILKPNDLLNQNTASYKFTRSDVLSPRNSTLFQSISGNDNGNGFVDQNDPLSSQLTDNSEPNAFEDLLSLPDQLPEKPAIEFQLNVAPCCKYASKVLGIFSGKRNKSFSDFTQRCFCAYCPRYFNRLAKNPFAGDSSGETYGNSKSEGIPPSVYWTRALWLTLQCMKI
ncbi:hypothetical protein AVEN_179445-1 [Araneus ventricosus]|uniref:Uncharacterized protein n=1 Tax=Araneus ventricosus TaxID=182803 RepID=A0A4Y2BHB1_ARAVE|nr:hypothetical protein AVEN_179445-1 [Araneus ventricosus]